MIKFKKLLIVGLALALGLFAGCASVATLAPFPNAGAWDSTVKPLGTVTADSGKWPLALHAMPPDYTFYSALKKAASKQFGVPEDEIVLGEVSIKTMSEIDGTMRSWKATASAGQKKKTP
jgi:hypothetical protein